MKVIEKHCYPSPMSDLSSCMYDAEAFRLRERKEMSIFNLMIENNGFCHVTNLTQIYQVL